MWRGWAKRWGSFLSKQGHNFCLDETQMKSIDRRIWLIFAVLALLCAALWAAGKLRFTLLRFMGEGNAREPSVLYLANSQAPELWVNSAQGDTPRQLTVTGGKVFDYNVSGDGSKIIYSVQNEQKGLDLWEMDRQGDQTRLLLACAADWCINPAYSPDGKKIAYSRRRASQEGVEPDAPGVWIFDPAADSTDPLYTNANIGGFTPVWSPDGQSLAFFDGLSLGVRIFEINSGADMFFESHAGMVGEWSPDSRQFLYLDYLSGQVQPYAVVYLVDVETRQPRRLLGGEGDPVDYSTPSWSPDGDVLAVALRPLSGSLSKQLWLMRPDGSQVQSITTDQTFTHASYHWSPDGQMLVFQRLQLGASASRPQVAVWKRSDGTILQLAEDAFQPRWLP